jgi:uncharacterized protein YoxC
MSSVDSRPGFWTRLGRAFINFLKVLLFLLLVGGIGFGVWYGYQAVIAPTTSRATINSQRIDLLRSDVDTLMADTADAEAIATLEAEVVALEAQVDSNQEALAADLQDQQEILAGLQLQVAGLVTDTEGLAEEITRLQDGLVALQEDVNANSIMVDELGGAVDQVEAEMRDLETAFAAVREDAGELAQMEQTLTLFRVWELLSRARLHLLEGNAGLAEADVAVALATVNGLLAAEEAAAGSPLLTLQERLELALANLPADPQTASRDLETAWETLDQLLVELLGIAEVEVTSPVTGTLPLTATAPITATRPVTP